MTDEEKAEAGPKWSRMSREERLKVLEDNTPKAFEVLAENNPHWKEAFVHRLILDALRSLRYYLEEATDDAISWESPFVEVQIPAEPPEAPPMSDLPDEVLESPEKVTKAAGLRLDAMLLRAVIRELTGNAVTLRQGGVEYSWIPSDLQKKLDSWPKRTRERFLETYGDPFVLGATYFEEGQDFEEGPEDEPQKLTRRGKRRLGGVSPLFPFSGVHDKVPFSGSFAVAFHPLVRDEDAMEAYFPVVVGIQFSPLEDGEEPRFPNPAEWTKEEREQFWTAVLTPIKEAEQRLRGKGGTGETNETAAAPESAQTRETEPPPQETATTSTMTETPEIHTVDTMEALQSAALVLSVPGRVGPPPDSRKPRHLWNAETRIPKATAQFIRHAGKVTLPKRWSAIPKWEDLKNREILAVRNLYGDAAFYDMGEGSPALLEKRTRRDFDQKTGKRRDREEVTLTREAERALEDREGVKGFIRREKDKDGITREYLVKVISAGEGRITLSVSWYGRALFFAEDGLEKRREELEALRQRWEQGDLFEDLPPNHRDLIEGLFENITHVRNARVLMDAISRRFGAEGENPLRYPAHDLKLLLLCENDPHGMAKVQGSLRALQEVRFSIKATGGGSYQAYGPFLQHVAYEGRGTGSHGDGDFLLTVSPDFIGCLKAFEVRISTGKAVRAVFNWTRDLDEQEKALLKKQPFFKGFTISPYYDKAMKLTDHQSNLRAWIENQITRNSAPIPKHRKHLQVKRSAQDAQRPRLYGHDFCPLIPEGKLLAGALGSFRKNPEGAWNLGGTDTRATKTGGGHVGGLLSVLGYYYPPGAARAERQKAVWNALRDLTVVVEGLHGVVAVKTSGTWMSLEDARKSLPEEDLVKNAKWFLFVTADLMDHMGRVVEEYHQERFEKGETPYPIKVTRDRKLVEASRERETAETIGTLEEASKTGEVKVGLEWSPLWQRLRAAIKDKGLTQTKAAGLFGVSQPTFAGWIAGPERGHPIPEELVPLVKRWVDGGEPPTPEELASRKTKRPGVNPETGKPWTRPRKGPGAPPDDEE